jgi:aarF domain-containing kinase
MFHDTPWLKIPKIYWELSSDRVLTMEYVEGGQVNDLNYIKKNKIDPNEVSQKIGLLYSQMIFTHGFIHADPHPGNILVRKSCTGNTEIVLLDHGLYAASNFFYNASLCILWKLFNIKCSRIDLKVSFEANKII